MKKNMIRILKSIVIIFVLSIFSINSNAVYVQRYEQLKTKWCWAASAQMMGKALGRMVSQTMIVINVKGSDINEGANDQELKSSVTYATMRPTILSSYPLSFSKAKNELDSGEPFVIKIVWSGGGAHAVVVSDYNSSFKTLTVVDPWLGCGTKIFSYDAMITQCNFQSGTGSWDKTVYV